MKVENLTNGAISYEQEVSTATANTWEQLTFDYSAINTANSYQKITIILIMELWVTVQQTLLITLMTLLLTN